MIFRTRTVLEIPSCHSCMQVKTYQSSIPVDFRRLAEKNIPTCLSLSSSFCVAITVTSFTMRLPRALNPNENPAQFGIFFSADRLSSLSIAIPRGSRSTVAARAHYTTIRRFLVFCARFRPWPCRMLVSPPGRTASEFIDQHRQTPINEFRCGSPWRAHQHPTGFP